MAHIFRTGVSAALIASLAAPAVAQVTLPAPAPATPTAQVTPVAPVAPSVVLPDLSPTQAEQLVAMLDRASLAHGLRQTGSRPPITNPEPQLVAKAALDYARAVRSGRLDTADFIEDWGLRPERYDPLPAFADAVKRDRLAQWIASLPPPYAGYDGLQKGLEQYRTIRDAGGWTSLAAGPDLTVGAKGARVAALRKRLAVEDPEVAKTGDSFDAELKAAVVRAQRRYGLNPSGVVSTGTLAALNVPANARVQQIVANMERWRWLPPEMPKDRIQVNIAAAVVTVFEGDQPIMSMRGVTGRPGNATPMLKSTIHSIVLNPPWNVPTSIATKELWPKGAAYLTRNGYKIIGTGPNRRLQQQAGPNAALGRFKFDFDNPYAVYLHDTPSRGTFASYSRLASHGCIRLEKPQALAELLLRDDSAWAPETLQTAVDTGETQRVQLGRKAAVYLLYWTAFASQNGTMNFRGDPYSWDGLLADKIEKRSAMQTTVASR